MLKTAKEQEYDKLKKEFFDLLKDTSQAVGIEQLEKKAINLGEKLNSLIADAIARNELSLKYVEEAFTVSRVFKIFGIGVKRLVVVKC